MPGGADVGGKSIPTTDAVEYGSGTVVAGDDPEPVFSEADTTRSVILVADPNNDDLVLFGFDEDLTISNGVPLQAGQSIPIGHDVSETNIFVVANSGTQAYEFASLR